MIQPAAHMGVLGFDYIVIHTFNWSWCKYNQTTWHVCVRINWNLSLLAERSPAWSPHLSYILVFTGKNLQWRKNKVWCISLNMFPKISMLLYLHKVNHYVSNSRQNITTLLKCTAMVTLAWYKDPKVTSKRKAFVK